MARSSSAGLATHVRHWRLTFTNKSGERAKRATDGCYSTTMILYASFRSQKPAHLPGPSLDFLFLNHIISLHFVVEVHQDLTVGITFSGPHRRQNVFQSSQLVSYPPMIMMRAFQVLEGKSCPCYQNEDARKKRKRKHEGK